MSRFKRNEKGNLPVQPRKRKDVVVSPASILKNGKSNGNSNNNNGLNGGNGNGKLTPKQAKFVDEYLVDLNATQATIRAGYSKKTADVIASQNLSKIRVQQAIQKRRDELQKATQWTQEEVLNGYRKLAYYTLDEIYNDDGTLKPISEISPNARFAVSGVKILKTKTSKTSKDGGKTASETTMQDLKFSDKKAVLDQVGKHLGMFKDEEGSGPGNKFNFNAPVQINVGLAEE